MDIQELLKTGAEIFMSKSGKTSSGSPLQLGNVISALSGLLGGGKGLDLGSLLSKMKGGGLASMAESWLGNGANSSISADQVTNLFGQDKIGAFANQLGIGQNDAVSGLQAAIPSIIDKASPDGNLSDALGGSSGVLGKVKGLFGG